MPNIAPNSVTPRIELQSHVAPATETGSARANMSPESKALMYPALLDKRIGTGTVAGGLNDMLRFRITGTGPVSERGFVPDNSLTDRFAQTVDGQRLISQMRGSMTTSDDFSKSNHVVGVMLPPTLQSVAAGQILGNRESGQRTPHDLSGIYADTKSEAKFAGAWNDSKWITIMPDTARMMLTAVGAYTPSKIGPEKFLRHARLATYVDNVEPHELQHSITPATNGFYGGDNGAHAWLEEGVADALSKTGSILVRNAGLMGVDPHSYAGFLAHHTTSDLDWPRYKPIPLTPAEKKANDEKGTHNYENGAMVVRNLLRMSGVDFRTSAGIDSARHILQDKSATFVPGRLADAIITANKLDPAVREQLRDRILNADANPDVVAGIRKDFGITVGSIGK